MLKKIISFLIFLSLLLVVSCSKGYDFDLKIDGDTISWNAIDGAKIYYVYAGDEKIVNVKDNYYTLSLEEGEYLIKVCAKVGDDVTNFSNVVSYTATKKIDLVTPYISLNGDMLEWIGDTNYESYDIYVNDQKKASISEVSNAKLTFDLAAYENNSKVYIQGNGINGKFKTSNTVVLRPDKQSKINIFQINDTHGAAITDDSMTGLDKVETLIKVLEKANGEYIKIANGDIFQGGYVSNMTRGKIFVDILNAMHFDCFVIGNHEFDWGLEEVAKFKDGNLENGEADFDFLSANIVYKGTSTTPSWLEPYTVLETGGYKIGIIGVIGEYLTSSISATKVQDYEFLDPVPLVDKYTKELRDAGCDLVIVSNHEYEPSTNERIAALNNKVDVIICGHSHQLIEEYVERGDGYRIPVIQSNTKNITVGAVEVNMVDGAATTASIQHYRPASYNSDSDILAIARSYQSIINDGEAVVCSLSRNYSRNDLGMLAVDAFVEKYNVAVGIINTGGVRTTLSKGTVYARDVLEVFPFENEILLVTMSGQALKRLYNYGSDYLYFSSNFDANSLNNSSYYEVAVIDYVYTGDSYTQFFAGFATTYSGDYINAVVTDYLKHHSL